MSSGFWTFMNYAFWVCVGVLVLACIGYYLTRERGD